MEKKRWFILKGPLLSYYKSQDDLGNQQGRIAVPGFVVGKADNEVKRHFPFKLYHSGPGRIWYFSAESEQDRDKWLSMLHLATKLISTEIRYTEIEDLEDQEELEELKQEFAKLKEEEVILAEEEKQVAAQLAELETEERKVETDIVRIHMLMQVDEEMSNLPLPENDEEPPSYEVIGNQ